MRAKFAEPAHEVAAGALSRWCELRRLDNLPAAEWHDKVHIPMFPQQKRIVGNNEIGAAQVIRIHRSCQRGGHLGTQGGQQFTGSLPGRLEIGRIAREELIQLARLLLNRLGMIHFDRFSLPARNSANSRNLRRG